MKYSAWNNTIRWRQTAPWTKVFHRTSLRVSAEVAQSQRKNGRLRDRNMTWTQCTNSTLIVGSITWARQKANSRSNRCLTSVSRQHGTWLLVNQRYLSSIENLPFIFFYTNFIWLQEIPCNSWLNLLIGFAGLNFQFNLGWFGTIINAGHHHRRRRTQ